MAEKSIDYIRENIREEMKNNFQPQFERLAKLEAKIGYQIVPSFYLLVHFITELLPALTGNNKNIDINELTKKAKMMAITYLRLNDSEFTDFIKSEDKALDLLDLD